MVPRISDGDGVIRVLEVLATLKRAGAERMVTSLVQRLDRNRFDPHVVTLFDATPGDLEAEIGVPVRRLGKRPGLDLRMYPRLRAAIRDVRPDVIHTHSYVLRYVLPVAGRVPVVHTVHNLAGQEVDRIGRWVHRIAFRRGVRPVAVAEEVARTFAAEYGFVPPVIPNGVDLTRFAGVRPKSGGPFTVLAVARLEPQKNPAVLAEAVASLPFEARFLIAGEGSLRPALDGRPRVTLLGVRSDIADVLASADVFALASDYEGHPIALLEAMAAGLPVVATAVGGVPEMVGDAGLLVPPRDVPALAGALERLHRDADLRAELGRKARERVVRFDVGAMVEAYSHVFKQAVAAP